MKQLTFIDWFAGVGGFRRGMELAGHKCVGFCEYDKFATASYVSMHLITEEQREHLATMDLKKRQKEILKHEYRNGEWYARDIRTVNVSDIPRADAWCFGFPCQDISVAGAQRGFEGNRSSLFFRVMYLVSQIRTEERPDYLFIENVRNLLSVNGGWDFARLLVELDRGGYDAEWQVVNSKNYGVPQNRERVFIIGHSRNGRTAKVFPISGSVTKNSVGIIGHRDIYRRNMQTFNPDGITEALDTAAGGGRGHHVAVFAIDKNVRGKESGETARCLTARYDKGVANVTADATAIAYPINTEPDGTSRTIKASAQRITAENYTRKGSYAQTGVALKIDQETAEGVPVIWYDKRQCYIAIRKLTPRECWRLQGWTDDYFERAQFVNSDSQLYKQAGNGVTVTVIQAIAERLGNDT